jgi:NADPH-dependent ferric siderophore reductase
MTIFSKVAQAARKVSGRAAPRVLVVKDASYLTPNMIRVVFAGPELAGFPGGREGGNCKLFFPDVGESKEDFATRLADGSSMLKRTFTVRSFDADNQALTIDFVAHGEQGPASRWASHAKPGDFLGFSGASAPKVDHFEADWYLVAADPSAIPVAAATLQAMPRDAKGVAIFEVISTEDRQDIDMPAGIDAHWLIQPDPNQPSTAQETLIRSLAWPEGRVQTCIAGESGVIRSLRAFLTNEKQMPREDMYISGYWKIGLVEDEHQKIKRAEQ